MFQKIVSCDETPESNVIDRMHNKKYITNVNNYLHSNKKIASLTIFLASILFDINFVITGVDVVVNNNYKVFAITMCIMMLRHMCQYFNRLPFPRNMIWYDPGFPTLINTYETSNDFFFSGHTAFSLTWGLNLFFYTVNPYVKIYPIFFIAYEIIFLAATKSHYFMDIYAGITTYFTLSYFFGHIL